MDVGGHTELVGPSCPWCAARPRLELVLRLERETREALLIMACPACGRVYRLEAGSDAVDEIDPGELALSRVSCPRCRSVGYAMLYDVPPDEVEIYTILTCQVCRFTFQSEVVGGTSVRAGRN